MSLTLTELDQEMASARYSMEHGGPSLRAIAAATLLRCEYARERAAREDCEELREEWVGRQDQDEDWSGWEVWLHVWLSPTEMGTYQAALCSADTGDLFCLVTADSATAAYEALAEQLRSRT
jgi:hypothetical protein